MILSILKVMVHKVLPIIFLRLFNAKSVSHLHKTALPIDTREWILLYRNSSVCIITADNCQLNHHLMFSHSIDRWKIFATDIVALPQGPSTTLTRPCYKVIANVNNPVQLLCLPFHSFNQSHYIHFWSIPKIVSARKKLFRADRDGQGTNKWENLWS